MDKIIENLPYIEKDGLRYCDMAGIAYQVDMTKSVPYDQAYFDKYVRYEKAPMGRKLNNARVDAVKTWAKDLSCIDIGIGCGTFIKYAQGKGINFRGYDINPVGVNWLKKRKIYSNPYTSPRTFFCFTFWDSLEHIPDPQKIFNAIPVGAYVFVSIPILPDLECIPTHKHYKPNEHFYYFTSCGFLLYMRRYNFGILKVMDFENESGRESIKTFVFEKMAKL